MLLNRTYFFNAQSVCSITSAMDTDRFVETRHHSDQQCSFPTRQPNPKAQRMLYQTTPGTRNSTGGRPIIQNIFNILVQHRQPLCDDCQLPKKKKKKKNGQFVQRYKTNSILWQATRREVGEIKKPWYKV